MSDVSNAGIMLAIQV